MSSANSMLTKGLFHIHIAKNYLEGFKNECKQSAKNDANKWLNKINALNNDIYSVMTPVSREIYMNELKQNDPLVYENIFSLMLQMNNEQRELLETIATGIVKNEVIEFVNPQQ